MKCGSVRCGAGGSSISKGDVSTHLTLTGSPQGFLYIAGLVLENGVLNGGV